MNPDRMPLLGNWEFREDLESRVAHAVCESLSRFLPVKDYEAAWVCRAYMVNHRFDVFRCGQDLSGSRINLFTDNKGNVVKIHIG